MIEINPQGQSDSRLLFYAFIFFSFEIAYSVGFFLYMFKEFTLLQKPVLALELASYFFFLMLAARAFQRFPFKWLWVGFAFVVGFGVPAALSFAITKRLSEAAAPNLWFGATFIAISLIKLAVAGGIYVWSINRRVN